MTLMKPTMRAKKMLNAKEAKKVADNALLKDYSIYIAAVEMLIKERSARGYTFAKLDNMRAPTVVKIATELQKHGYTVIINADHTSMLIEWD